MNVDRVRQKRSRVFRALLGALSAVLISSTAGAQQAPLKADRYGCSATTLTSAVPGRAYPGRPATFDMPQMISVPALFGDIIIDGRGGYRLPKIGTSGRALFDRASGALSFTGDLSAFKVQRIRDHDAWFALSTSDMRFDCGPYSANGARPHATGTAPATPSAPAAPVRALTPAEKLTGTFSGVYSCGDLAAFRLELLAKPDGTLTGRFAFGPPRDQNGQVVYSVIGSYAVSGTWQENKFSLNPDRWIEQPKGGYQRTNIYGATVVEPYNYHMVGVSGVAEPSGNSSGGFSLSGTIGDCSSFHANRDK